MSVASGGEYCIFSGGGSAAAATAGGRGGAQAEGVGGRIGSHLHCRLLGGLSDHVCLFWRCFMSGSVLVVLLPLMLGAVGHWVYSLNDLSPEIHFCVFWRCFT